MSEIRYFIDPIESKTHGVLALRLSEKPLSLGALKQAVGSQALSDLLIKEESKFQGITPTSFQLVHISSTQAVAALTLLAPTQHLYFNQKQLVVDLYTKVEFYYRVELLDQQRIQVFGRLRWRQYDIDVCECDWIGQGKSHWFIQGISLRLIHTPLSWKRLQQMQHPCILEGMEKTAFLEEQDEDDPDCPQMVLIGGTQADAERLADPLPILMLKDRSGAFADLWLDYGNNIRVAMHETSKEIKSSKGNVARQFEVEKNWEKDLLETDFVRKEVSSSHYYCPIDKVSKSLIFLLELGWKLQDSRGQRIIRQEGLDLAIHETKQTLVVKGAVRYAEFEADVTAVVGAFNRKERFIQLSPGTVGLLETSQSIDEILNEKVEIVGQEIRVKKNQMGNFGHLLTHANLAAPVKDLKDKLEHFQAIEEAYPDPTFRGKLRPYQQAGLNWLAFLVAYNFHGILADDMGLGKTVQVLALLSRLLPEKHSHLIIVPTSLLFNWKNEIETFLPHASCYMHYGPRRVKTVQELINQGQIILTSYATLRLDLSLLQNVSYQSVILDEAQVIKNATTQTAKAVCELQAQFRLSITGTPLENHLGELWSHFNFLMPDLFGTEESFGQELQAAEADRRYLQRIKRKIAPFILRRKKEEVAKDLPERIDQVIWVEMADEQRRVYDRFLAGFRGGLLQKVEAEGASAHRMEIFEAILRLRQICCHPLLVSSMVEEEQLLPSAKFEAILQDIETIREEGRKVLVYSQFTSLLQLLSRAANEKKWSYAYLDGSTTNREKVVDSFQNDPNQQLFFISLKAGGVGLNLTAADYVLLCDPWWNEAAEEQAINRAHRIGRKSTVIAKRFLTLESIEEKMVKLKAAKRGTIDAILDDEVGSLRFTAEDLRYLFS
jgi:SNF2 family DNA or RNA helicase